MPRISVRPADALLDRPVAIDVTELTPRSRVRVRLRQHTLRAESWAEFVATDAGSVDVGTQAPVAGDYDGIDAAGLFWSARFDAGFDVVTMVDVLSRLEPLDYTLTASTEDRGDATIEFRRKLLADDIVRAPVRAGRLRGTLFAPAGNVNAPGVVVLGGSDGGNLWGFVAALLAAHGIAALSLAYFAHDDLPRELIEIPLEYFGEAVDWLRHRPEVGGNGVGILGLSRGGEAALLVGASFPNVAAVIALVPSGLTGNAISTDFSAMARSAWTLHGVPFAVFPPPGDPLTFTEAQHAFTTGAPFAGAPAMRRALQYAGDRVEDVAIPVERMSGPVLMISAEDDQLWGSSLLTEVAEQRLRRAKFPHVYEHVRYPNAGHFAVLPPNLPTTSNWGRHPVVPMALAFGGTPDANAQASADIWARVVSFLRTYLATPADV